MTELPRAYEVIRDLNFRSFGHNQIEIVEDYMIPETTVGDLSKMLAIFQANGLGSTGRTTAIALARRLYINHPAIATLREEQGIAIPQHYLEWGNLRQKAEHLGSLVELSGDGTPTEESYAYLSALYGIYLDLGVRYVDRPANIWSESNPQQGYQTLDGLIVSIPRGDIPAYQQLVKSSVNYYIDSVNPRLHFYSGNYVAPEKNRNEFFNNRVKLATLINTSIVQFGSQVLGDPDFIIRVRDLMRGEMGIEDNRELPDISQSLGQDLSLMKNKEKHDRTQGIAVREWAYQEVNDPVLQIITENPLFFWAGTGRTDEVMLKYNEWWPGRNFYRQGTMDVARKGLEDWIGHYGAKRSRVIRVRKYAEGVLPVNRRDLDRSNLVIHLDQLALEKPALASELKDLKPRTLQRGKLLLDHVAKAAD